MANPKDKKTETKSLASVNLNNILLEYRGLLMCIK